jgi:hypothetical protein
MNGNLEKESTRLCGVCGAREAILPCDGCKTILCGDCVKHGLYGTGCGCIQPLFLCPLCYDDPGINP